MIIQAGVRFGRAATGPPQPVSSSPIGRGYDPAKAPTFRWPPKVIEAFKRIEAEKARKRKQRK